MNDVTLSPGMGAYLNMLNSAKAPAGQIANENYPRELMQLFTIGLDMLNDDGTLQLDGNGNPIPTYTQDQVQAFAKAYTGWTYATSTRRRAQQVSQPHSQLLCAHGRSGKRARHLGENIAQWNRAARRPDRRSRTCKAR